MTIHKKPSYSTRFAMRNTLGSIYPFGCLFPFHFAFRGHNHSRSTGLSSLFTLSNHLKINALRLTALCFCLFSLRAAATTYYVDINSTNAAQPYANWSTAATDIQNAINQTANKSTLIGPLNRLRNETLK